MSERPRFAADEMLGSLTRWLRLMGYDTKYCRNIEDTPLLELSIREGRFLLTRDKNLAERAGERGLYVASDDLDTELRQVVGHFSLVPDPDLARCTVCDGELRTIGKEDAAGHVPDGSLTASSVFFVCKDCGKYYWRGSHWKNIMKRMEGVSPGARADSSPR